MNLSVTFWLSCTMLPFHLFFSIGVVNYAPFPLRSNFRAGVVLANFLNLSMKIPTLS